MTDQTNTDPVFESDDAAYAWLADEARRVGSETPATDDREALAGILRDRRIWNGGATDLEDADVILAWMSARRPSPPTEEQWEYVPGHRWVDANGREHWLVQAGVIGPATVDEYLAEGGEVIRRKVGPWETVEAAARVGSEG